MPPLGSRAVGLTSGARMGSANISPQFCGLGDPDRPLGGTTGSPGRHRYCSRAREKTRRGERGLQQRPDAECRHPPTVRRPRPPPPPLHEPGAANPAAGVRWPPPDRKPASTCAGPGARRRRAAPGPAGRLRSPSWPRSAPARAGPRPDTPTRPRDVHGQNGEFQGWTRPGPPPHRPRANTSVPGRGAGAFRSGLRPLPSATPTPPEQPTDSCRARPNTTNGRQTARTANAGARPRVPPRHER